MKNEKQKIIDDFIKRVDPYKKPEPLNFDLRGYSAYIKEHNLSAVDIDESVFKKFIIEVPE